MSRIESLFREFEENGDFLDHSIDHTKPNIFFTISKEKYYKIKEMFI